jgi:hypothetical protein
LIAKTRQKRREPRFSETLQRAQVEFGRAILELGRQPLRAHLPLTAAFVDGA